ncbi:related to SSK2 - MAP kinase kinase kinase of the high osmolarity signal transduction pathway [Melanopsichium pennsylvanicum]|uniref:Related to SSK2 - MAP kinase kinase kinase of the high osmolarity signal transduction pathway n=2 Tax=Melanopsichium pennsylvanicum TaxID=63383 RepID=A0AAJ5C4A3_9BASI|nr:related to SSK2-MAP kinase kinase kinase of the high osmolarity signal transduction pathway [Melanopsichium pennsylvanicum 4]SNX83353.1 related to SSK2 - MAP kinase kinase kinase of the high osmolarity signal transduction pathway [Melanopsichium pennsylvanicum]
MADITHDNEAGPSTIPEDISQEEVEEAHDQRHSQFTTLCPDSGASTPRKRRVASVSFQEPANSSNDDKQSYTPPSRTAAAGENGAAKTETDTLPRIPAAGPGTRTQPRRAPRSSSSLRHVTMNRTRTSSIAQPLPEDRDLSTDPNYFDDPTTSLVQRQVNVEKRRAERQRRQDAALLADFDDEDDDDQNGSSADEANPSKHHNPKAVVVADEYDYFSRSGSAYDKSKSKASIPPPGNNNTLGWSSASASDDSDDWDGEGPRNGLVATAGARALKPPFGSLAAPVDSSIGVTATPGPSFPSDLHTPADVGETETPILNPQHRMEWQSMLESVLNSEVLKSETKRINSVDTPDLSRQELSYQRWLDIKATLRGRGLKRGAIDEEEKRLKEGFGKMLKNLAQHVRDCRAEHTAKVESSAGQSSSSWTDTLQTSRGDIHESDSSTRETQGNVDPSRSVMGELGEASAAPTERGIEKEAVLAEVGELLGRIDSAEEQFPSTKRAIELVPEWGDADVQAKLASLYSWYNTTTSLRLQIDILRKWTGSDSLEIAAHGARNHNAELEKNEGQGHEQRRSGRAPADDDSTFVERIQKEGSLQSTFEKRTLASLYQLITKAKETILKFHIDFKRMALPSFEPELVTLINFPTRLMQGALRLRLDYAGKLAEPSVLIVDSLTDDLRTALAMACRVKLNYTSIIVADPERGWDLAPCIAEGYDDVLRSALKFFFKLLRLKLKASIYFKETEILEPEWRFLSTAVESIEGGDVIVATNITRFVNKLFDRIARYFNRELTATMMHQDQHGRRLPNPTSGPVGLAKTDQAPNLGSSTASDRAAHGKNFITLEDRAKWIHSVFDNVRIRSRKLLGFARDIRNRLDNAAEYDLGTLRPSADYLETDDQSVAGYSDAANAGAMTLSSFMLTLIDHDYFLVYTEALEENGIYLIAEPSLQDKPDLIQELVCKCLHRVRPGEEESSLVSETTATALNADGEGGEDAAGGGSGNANALREQLEKQSGANAAASAGNGTAKRDDDADDHPRYILLLSPRDPFMWTGKVMHHVMPRVDIALADRRVRLIADGPKGRLELAKRHFQRIFTQFGAGEDVIDDGSDDGQAGFPLETLNDQMAHMSRVQSGLEDINKGVYMLSDTIIRKVPEIRRRLRGLGVRARAKGGTPRSTTSDNPAGGLGGSCDELIQNCYSMAAEHGRRALPFIESARLRDQMTLALGRLAIDWIAFICDDCVPSERKTFKWAVTALGNANHITSAENIFRLNEPDFALLRSKVASCMALLISHFDILGARSSVAKAQEEQEKLEREKAERNRITAGSADAMQNLSEDFHQLRLQNGEAGVQASSTKTTLLGPGIGAQMLVNKLDRAMQATEERWISKVLEWDAARHELEAEQRLIGRVLDDTRLEDRSLQFLAQSASKITIRWQQGQFIGGGTFGTVYLAVNLDSGGLMAVKEIRFQDISSTPSLYQQIKDEMEVMSMLSHPNIVEYYGIEVHRDRVYIFEEYCQGGSLAALLEHGRIEDETVIQVYTLQMLEGLIYLHSQGIIHRDIKPDNILLDHMGVLKYVDFGAAKILAKNSRTIQRSRKTGGLGNIGMLAAGGEGGKQGGPAGAMASLQGTPMYMSPEVIKGNADVPQSAADVWSLGCVVLEFATGKRPWSNFDNEWAIMFHIGMAEQHPALPDASQLSPMGIEFIRQCLTINPKQRPSAIQLKEDPWMRSLIEELDAANEAEAAAELAGVPLHADSGFDDMASRSGASSVTSSLETGHHAIGGGGGPQTSGVESQPQGSLFKSLDRTVSSLNSTRSRWSNSERGSGETGITSPYNPNMSLKASLGFRQQQQMRETQIATVVQGESQQQQEQEQEEKEEGTTGNNGAEVSMEEDASDTEVMREVEEEDDEERSKRPVHVPGHPNHSHPGYPALVADLQYQKEQVQRLAMLRHDSSLSTLPDE